MSPFHVPPEFGKTPRPHIHRFDGQWWATFPANWPEPTNEQCAPFAAWLRHMNGIHEPRPTSFLFPAHERMQ